MKPLKPVMAALLAASSAALLPGTSRAMVAAAKCVKDAKTGIAELDAAMEEAGETMVRGRIACVLHNDPRARADVAQRMYEFLMAPAGDKSFVDAHLRDDAASEPVRTGLRAEIGRWAEKATVDDLSAVYYLLGTGTKTPPWVGALEIVNALKTRDKCLGSLDVALAGWTSAPQPNAAATAPQQIAVDRAVAQVSGWLQDAATQAHGVLKDPRCINEIADSAKANETTRPKPPTITAGDSSLGSPAAGFDFDSLYRGGAVVRDVYGPDDSKTGWRTLSMKIYSMPGTDGKPKVQIGIVDITDPTKPYAPKLFDIDALQEGTQKFPLKAGGREYALTVTGAGADRQITLARPGTPNDDRGALSTSVSRLIMARADQAASGGVVSVDGKPYYVMGQGGVNGSVLFFPKDGIDKRAQIAAMKEPEKSNAMLTLLQAEATADVTKVDESGATVSVGGKPDLGALAGGPHHLEWDPNRQMWKVAKGAGDPRTPPETVKSKAGDGPSKGGGPSGPGGKPTSPEGEKTLDDVVARVMKAAPSLQTSDDEGELNDGFDDATKTQVRILAEKVAGVSKYHAVFAPSYSIPGGQLNWEPGGVVRRVWGAGAHIAIDMVDSEGTRVIMYYTPQQLADNNREAGASQASSGRYDPGKKSFTGVTDPALAGYILKTYLNADDDKVKTIVARAAKRGAGPGKGVMSGGADTVGVQVGDAEVYQVWPGDKRMRDNSKGGNAGMAGLVGPGAAANMAGGEFGGEFPDPQPAEKGLEPWRRVDAKADVALYKGQEAVAREDGAKTYAVWGLMIAYKNGSGGAVRTGRPISIFGDAEERLKLPPKYGMKGLGGVQVPSNVSLGMYLGSTQEKGAVAAYRYAVPAADGSNVRGKKDNCAGPVFWWGMTEDEAQKRCPAGKL